MVVAPATIGVASESSMGARNARGAAKRDTDFSRSPNRSVAFPDSSS